MSLGNLFEKIDDQVIISDLTPFLPPGTSLVAYVFGSSLPSLGMYFLLGPFGFLSTRIYSIGITSQNQLIVYDRTIKKAVILSPDMVTWTEYKKHLFSDTIAVTFEDGKVLGLSFTHRYIGINKQTENIGLLKQTLQSYPQKPKTQIKISNLAKIFLVSFLLSCLSFIPLIITRLSLRSDSSIFLTILLTAFVVMAIANKIFQGQPKMVSSLAGSSYGVFFALLELLTGQSLPKLPAQLFSLAIVGSLLGYVFGFFYGVVSKKDKYRDFLS